MPRTLTSNGPGTRRPRRGALRRSARAGQGQSGGAGARLAHSYSGIRTDRLVSDSAKKHARRAWNRPAFETTTGEDHFNVMARASRLQTAHSCYRSLALPAAVLGVDGAPPRNHGQRETVHCRLGAFFNRDAGWRGLKNCGSLQEEAMAFVLQLFGGFRFVGAPAAW